jgi:hypothetical protein
LQDFLTQANQQYHSMRAHNHTSIIRACAHKITLELASNKAHEVQERSKQVSDTRESSNERKLLKSKQVRDARGRSNETQAVRQQSNQANMISTSQMICAAS